jgi:hypothetical protein
MSVPEVLLFHLRPGRWLRWRAALMLFQDFIYAQAKATPVRIASGRPKSLKTRSKTDASENREGARIGQTWFALHAHLSHDLERSRYAPVH